MQTLQRNIFILQIYLDPIRSETIQIWQIDNKEMNCKFCLYRPTCAVSLDILEIFFDPETPHLCACLYDFRAWSAGVRGSFAPDCSGACLGSAWAQMELKLQLFSCLLIYTFGLQFNCANFTQPPELTSCFTPCCHLCSLWDPLLYPSPSLPIIAQGKSSCAGLGHLTCPSVLPPTLAICRHLGKS